MRSATVLTAGSWALALLLGFFIWVSPDSALYPSPQAGLIVAAIATLVWLVGAVMTGFPRSAPRLSFRTQVAAVSPVLFAILALILAGRGLLPHPILPLVVTILGAGGLSWWARKDPRGPSTRFEEIGVGVGLVFAVFIGIPALMLAIFGQTLWEIGTPNYGNAIDRFNSVTQVASYRPAVRPAISARAAGRAFDAISASEDTAWLPAGGPFAGWTGDSVVEKALHGLTPAERAWLAKLGTRPELVLIDTIAYAAVLDPWTGLTLPVPEGVNAYTLPLPRLMPVRAAARAQLYRAALAAADRRAGVADSLVLQVLGYALRIRDDSDQLLGALIGTAMAREAAFSLAALKEAGGAREEAAAIRRSLALPAGSASGDSVAGMRPLGLRRTMLDAAIAHAGPRAITWDLVAILGLSRCTNLNELLYGPSPMLRAAYDANQPPADASEGRRAAYEVMRRGVTITDSTATIALPFRPAVWALGRSDAGACVAAVGTIR
ncbi:MAG TPA: hypothetical protein VG940_02780 [Gemmatimonadales bacterium]|nr:hypothetical protein [Gemmatimonadales bacterium]